MFAGITGKDINIRKYFLLFSQQIIRFLEVVFLEINDIIMISFAGHDDEPANLLIGMPNLKQLSFQYQKLQ